VPVGAGDVSKVMVAVATLVAAVGGFVVAVRGGSSDSSPVPAVIIIRGSVLPEDDLSDSERDREWLWDEPKYEYGG
jgi:hypothetical protein